MMSPKERIKNEEFLKNFTFAGDFVIKEDELLLRESKSFESIKGKEEKGYLLFCVDGEIKHIAQCKGASSEIYKRIVRDYGQAKNETNGTYRRVNSLIKALAEKHVITAYFSTKDVNWQDKYNKIFMRKWEWNWRGRNKYKDIDRDTKKSIKKYDIDERLLEKDNGFALENYGISVKRDLKEKIIALYENGNKCKLESIEGCTTFIRRNKIMFGDKELYLEVHHLIPLSICKNREVFEKSLGFKFSDIGINNLDKAENMVCLCSNCHNKLHYGMIKDVKKMLKELYKQKENDLKKINLDIGYENLVGIYEIIASAYKHSDN